MVMIPQKVERDDGSAASESEKRHSILLSLSILENWGDGKKRRSILLSFAGLLIACVFSAVVARRRRRTTKALLSGLVGGGLPAMQQVTAAASECCCGPLLPAPLCADCTCGLGGSQLGLGVSVGAGLLGSSCCLLQLGLNLLATLNLAHVGCAGLNKVLGPWRKQLRLLTGAWLLTSWGLCLGRRSWRGQGGPIVLVRLSVQTLVCLGLTFLPEALVWLAERRGKNRAKAVTFFPKPKEAASEVVPKNAEEAIPTTFSKQPKVSEVAKNAEEGSTAATVVHLKVEGMACEACQLHVQGVINRSDGVLSSRVDFKTGRAELTLLSSSSRGPSSDDDAAAVVFDFAELKDRIEENGYDAELLNPDC